VNLCPRRGQARVNVVTSGVLDRGV
jgi:hypothetical protein